jgi:hypothetical protein
MKYIISDDFYLTLEMKNSKKMNPAISLHVEKWFDTRVFGTLIFPTNNTHLSLNKYL